MRNSRRGAIPSDLGALIDTLNSLEARVSKLETPSGSDLGSTLAKTNDNISELLLRRARGAEQDVNVVYSAGDPLPFATPAYAEQSFTLDEPRRVLIEGSAYVSMLAWNPGAGTPTDVYVFAKIRIGTTDLATGETTYTTSNLTTGAAFISGERALARNGDRRSLSNIVTLGPGEYTLSCSVTVEQFDAPSGTVTINNPRTIVQILEKA